MNNSVCVVCGLKFAHHEETEICGRMNCRSMHSWGPEEWEGAARMALARKGAGMALSNLDNEALRRTS